MGFRHLSKPSAMTYVRQNRSAGVCRIFDYPMFDWRIFFFIGLKPRNHQLNLELVYLQGPFMMPQWEDGVRGLSGAPL